jgi:hypothetical protein
MSVYLALGDSISIDDYTGVRGGGAPSQLAQARRRPRRPYAERIPGGLVPFASDSGGNLFLVGDHDLVWFWDHEREGGSDAVLPMNEPLDR